MQEKLLSIAREYPDALVSDQVRDVPRIAFNVNLAIQAVKRPTSDLAICDVGGGIGLFSLGCSAAGFQRTVLVDDFGDPVNRKVGSGVLDLHARYGIEVVSRDAVQDGIEDLGRFDIVTTFDSMEHWHNSPKRLFRQISEALQPGGAFVLGVPNCVSLRKRITVPLGHGKWSSMDDWYEQDVFRGHVREADVSDLRHIASDMGLQDVKIVGRNWLGYYSGRAAVRAATKIIDHPLRAFPSLCSDLYMVARKP